MAAKRIEHLAAACDEDDAWEKGLGQRVNRNFLVFLSFLSFLGSFEDEWMQLTCHGVHS